MIRLKTLARISATTLLAIAGTYQLSSCSDDDDEPKVDITGTGVTAGSSNQSTREVYLLNEGNMGKNNASLDCFDYSTGKYFLNIFAAYNPTATLGLGDTGNDLQTYNGRLYAVINGSNLVQVTDLSTGLARGTISIPSPRNIAFGGNYAYVTSYSSASAGDEKQPKGSVYKVNLSTLAIEGNAVTGYQPEGVVYSDGRLFVANSGGYMYPNYEHTISVVDAASMKVTGTIDCGLNLGDEVLDSRGNLYVISTGNYSTVSSKIYVINTRTATVSDSIATSVSAMAVAGDSLYIIGVEYKAPTYEPVNSYALYNTATRQFVGNGFITDGTGSAITLPYAVAVNPATREIFVADAKDYKTPGELRCYSQKGALKWKATTGVIPGHIAFSDKRLKGLK